VTPEELVVGRRNLAAHLKAALDEQPTQAVIVTRGLVRDLIEVLDQPASHLREAVEKLADFVEESFEGCEPSRGCTGCEALLKARDVRLALESAALLGTRPQPTPIKSREPEGEAAEELAAWYASMDDDSPARCRHCAAPLTPTPEGMLIDARPDTAEPWDTDCPEADGQHEAGAVRPLPTREQIAEAIDGALDCETDEPVPVQKLANAVLALLTGGKE
jgi:hypothetical protein